MPKAQCMTSKAEEDATTLFVGNLAEQVTEELLYELFLQVGPLANVKIPNDSKGGKRSFGFIRFKHICSPDYAIRILQGTSLFSRTINLQRRNKGDSNQRQKPPQHEQNRHNYNESTNTGKQYGMPEARHTRFESEPDINKLLEMSANIINTPNVPGSSRDYSWNNDNRHFNDHQRSFDDSNRRFNDNHQRGSRDFGNTDRNYQGGYDNRRYKADDIAPSDNHRTFDDRRGNSAGKSHHKQNRSHERRPYDSNNRSRKRY